MYVLLSKSTHKCEIVKQDLRNEKRFLKTSLLRSIGGGVVNLDLA